MATEKQVNYVMHLLNKAGYSIGNMNARFKELGASMRERSGNVRTWLENMERTEISSLIDKLK